jgi:hypothetical protein
MKSISFRTIVGAFTLVGAVSAIAQPKPALADAINAFIFNNTVFDQTSSNAPVTPAFSSSALEPHSKLPAASMPRQQHIRGPTPRKHLRLLSLVSLPP